MKLITFGDSLVSGYGLRYGESWCDIVQASLKNELNLTLINKGFPGDTTTGLLSRSYNDVISKVPDVAIVLIGTNDLLLGRKHDTIIANILLLLEELASSSILAIPAAPPPILKDMAETSWDSGLDYDKISHELEFLVNSLRYQIKKRKLPFIDFYNLFMNLKINSLNPYYIDGIHPNADGNLKMAGEVKKIIREYSSIII